MVVGFVTFEIRLKKFLFGELSGLTLGTTVFLSTKGLAL